MTSSDGTVKLTSHRILYYHDNSRKQMELADYERSEQIKIFSKSSEILTIIFITLTAIIFISRLVVYLTNPTIFYWFTTTGIDYIFNDNFLLVMCLLLSIFFGFRYMLSIRHYLRITGKYESFIIQLIDRNPKFLQKFLQTLEVQSRIRKKAAVAITDTP